MRSALKRPFKWLLSLVLLPFKLLISAVGTAISFLISLIIFFALLAAIGMALGIVPVPESVPLSAF